MRNFHVKTANVKNFLVYIVGKGEKAGGANTVEMEGGYLPPLSNLEA